MFSRRTNWNRSPNLYTTAVDAHRQAGKTALDLTASNPTTIGLHYDPQLLRAFLAPDAMHYAPEPRGLRVARDQVAAYYQKRGDSVSADQVILTTSTSEAYSFAFRLLCDPDDEVLVPSPSYPLFDFLAELQDVRLKPYSLFYDHGWHVDLHSVRTAVSERTRAIMAVHPNNPTGSYLHAAEIAELNALCAGRSLALVVDEVFLDFAHDEVRRPSFATNHAALTFTLSGLSKISGLPQMKFAWLAVSGPESLAAEALERLEVIADTYLSMNAPAQHAAAAMFEQRHTFQQQLMARILANLAELDAQLSRQSLSERFDIEGGWYATLRVPVTRSDEELAVELLQQRDVLVHPGHFYDFPGAGHLVLSLITPEPVFRDGLSRVLDFIA